MATKAKPTPKKTRKPPIAKKQNRTVTITWDYNEAKLWYISNPTVTQAMVAEKYGIAEVTVSVRAVKDKWADAKAEYSQTMEREAVANAKIKVRQTLDRQVKEAQSLSVIGANALQRTWTAVKDDKRKAPNAKDLMAAMRAIETGHRLERLALGLPTSYQGFADKDGDTVDPSVNLNVVTFQQFVQNTLDRARRNGVIDAEPE